MAEYVTKEQVIDWYRPYGQTDDPIPFETLVSDLRDMKTADVAPVRHGRWDDEHKCTVCHNEALYKISNIRPDYDYDWEENLVETGDYILDIEWVETAYCQNCGAKIDGGIDNG